MKNKIIFYFVLIMLLFILPIFFYWGWWFLFNEKNTLSYMSVFSSLSIILSFLYVPLLVIFFSILFKK
ncbi:hypothetical protein BAB42_13530 [Salmonella enterica subsp. enterica serovar Poano]|nr:hypothetical protein [Salmonella enterica subsp. enterica serovar Poano]ECS5198845.1 hypothetical protein [Salmonella enterica subsp. enterica serovar Poano]